MNTFDWKWLTPRHWLTWLGILVFMPLAFFPWQARRWLGQKIGNWIYRHNTKRRHVALTNLKQCLPNHTSFEYEKLAQQHLHAYMHAMLDYSVLFFRSRKWLYSRITIQGREHIENAIEHNQNVILLLGHSVWLEFAPTAIGEHYAAYGSYNPFKNPIINWLIANSRLKDVEFVIAREEGMMKLVRSLIPKRLMIFLPDEDLGLKAAVFAPFFGTAKATLTTPSRLSKLGKAVALPLMAFFNVQTGKYDIIIAPPLDQYPSNDEHQDALRLNQALEQLIVKNDATQYMWLMKIFRTRPTGEARIY